MLINSMNSSSISLIIQQDFRGSVCSCVVLFFIFTIVIVVSFVAVSCLWAWSSIQCLIHPCNRLQPLQLEDEWVKSWAISTLWVTTTVMIVSQQNILMFYNLNMQTVCEATHGRWFLWVVLWEFTVIPFIIFMFKLGRVALCENRWLLFITITSVKT